MTPSPAALLSVDPGSHSGWALWARGGVVVAGRALWLLTRWGQVAFSEVEPEDEPLIVTALLGKLREDWRDACLVVEGQWYRPPSYRGGQRQYHCSPWRDVQRLTENRCAWADAARIAGADVEVIDPGRWIVAMTGRDALGKTPDDRLRWVARQRWPKLQATSHEAASLMLGAWWIEEHRGKAVVELEGKGER